MPTHRNDISGGAGAGIGGFVLQEGDGGASGAGEDGFVLEEGDSLVTYGDDYDRPAVQVESRGRGKGKKGGRGGGRRKKGGWSGKRNYRGGKGRGKKKSGGGNRKRKAAASSGADGGRAWAAREAGIGSYHGGVDDRFELGGGASMNF
jgi:hypothetical protein